MPLMNRSGARGLRQRFINEVRRFYRFFPSVTARVRLDFAWRGYRFEHGTRVLLDLYGTNLDARSCGAPDQFRPERFAHWDGGPFSFIPQGGGDQTSGHRCACEWITIALMKTAVNARCRQIVYDVPGQDLTIDVSRLPALPRSGFVIRNVRPHAPVSAV